MNWQTFRTRALTALVFVAVMMAGLLWNAWSFFVLFSVVHFGAWVEFQKITALINPDYRQTTALHRYGLMLGGWGLMLFFTNAVLRVGGVVFTEAGFWMVVGLMLLLPLLFFIERRLLFLKNILYSLLGLIYISLPLALLMDLRTAWGEEQYQLAMTLPLLAIFCLWINDTMAYVVGSFIGKTPLSPISPKKTWEGTIGGVVLTIAVMALLAYFTQRLAVVHAAVIAGLAAITGTLGDLFESKLKRMAGIKDSGRIMPGHGGFLDRFDSLLFAVVVVWLYAKLVF